MRAREKRRAPGAAKRVTGALLLAMPGAGIAIDSAVAHAKTQPVSHATATHHRSTPTRFVVSRRTHHKLRGRMASVPGRLLGAHPHVRVLLQLRVHHHWKTIARTRDGRHGGFKLRYRVRFDRTMRLRVRFRGGDGTRPSAASAGRMIGLTRSVASWYYDAGSTACGFHAGYGVANKTLPCGTHVTFVYHGHIVKATVDDRGPYVAGRSYDLNQNTARKLGMGGVVTVDASI